MKHLYGMICATITPMSADGSVDIKSAKRLYHHLVENGVHCLYPNGTNGESLSLTCDERKRLAELCVMENAGKSVVYIQCGASTISESYIHIRHAQSVGADGAGLMTPVFFPMDESSMEAYYSRALELAADYPLYIYNIASRTGNDVSAALFGRLFQKYVNLLGIKFSSPDLLRLEQYVHAGGNTGADVLIGCDHLALSCLTLGGSGYVSGPGAAFHQLYVNLYGAFRAGNLSGAMELQQQIHQTLENMRGIPEIPAVKYLLMRQGIIANDTCRAPLRPLTDNEKRRLEALL